MKGLRKHTAVIISLVYMLAFQGTSVSALTEKQNDTHPIEKPYWWWSWCDYDIRHPELQYHGYFIDDGYDLKYDVKMKIYTETTICWWCDINKKDKTVSIEFEDLVTPESEQPWFSNQTVRVPDTVNGYTVTEYSGSSAFKAFDVDPDNEYFMSDGTVLFSKDGKKLLSFAQYSPVTEYTVPQGVENRRQCICPQRRS